MAPKALADRFDHIVLTVDDIEETTSFYELALGFEREIFPGSDGRPRYALRFGNQKINLQDRATDTVNKAQTPTFGSGDFCLIAAVPLDQMLAHLRAENVAIVADGDAADEIDGRGLVAEEERLAVRTLEVDVLDRVDILGGAEPGPCPGLAREENKYDGQ